jgi:hypothetical protein
MKVADLSLIEKGGEALTIQDMITSEITDEQVDS